MSIDTAKYTEFLQQGQEAARQAVDVWARTVTTAATQLATFTPRTDAEAVIDRYFDLNEKLLAAQRDLAKQGVGWATTAAARVREYAEPVVKGATTSMDA
jgi:3-methyladenine DNA glycosylase AlkD